MSYLFQSLLLCKLNSELHPLILLAASGSCICSFSFPTGSLLAVWRARHTAKAGGITPKDSPLQHSVDGLVDGYEDPGRPPKRRKKGSKDNDSGSSSAEIVTEFDPMKHPKELEDSDLDVIELVSVSNGQYVVAVTDQDKSVRVLHLNSTGILEQVSERQALRETAYSNAG